jgi:hypothetical protein
MSALEDGPIPFERYADRHADAGAEREWVLTELRRRIRSRLQPVICHLPEGEIDALVERIAHFKYRHEGKTALRTTPARGNPIGAQDD